MTHIDTYPIISGMFKGFQGKHSRLADSSSMTFLFQFAFVLWGLWGLWGTDGTAWFGNCNLYHRRSAEIPQLRRLALRHTVEVGQRRGKGAVCGS